MGTCIEQKVLGGLNFSISLSFFPFFFLFAITDLFLLISKELAVFFAFLLLAVMPSRARLCECSLLMGKFAENN